MPNTYTLMTAMPPTKGHVNLLMYAAALAYGEGGQFHVVLCTQPGEPFVEERADAILAIMDKINVDGVLHRVTTVLPQEPDEESEAEFYGMWAGFLTDFGLTDKDYIVGSEYYGNKLAEYTGARFMPYDIDRSILKVKATYVREDPLEHFPEIAKEFQPYLRKTVTIFGAESTGKTTLSKALAGTLDGVWLPEWARPYMETVSTQLTDQGMREIWAGQRALQDHGPAIAEDKPFIIQDTDLLSTVGYWDQADSGMWEGGASETPLECLMDAIIRSSDLYIVCPSNIPFEPNVLRFGGDKRETPDSFWIKYLDQHQLNYIVLESDTLNERITEATAACVKLFGSPLEYQREGKEYESK